MAELDTKRIRALCFDVDGTLSDTDDAWVSRIGNVLQPLAFAFPQRDTRTFARRLLMAFESPANLVYHWLDHLGMDDELARLYHLLSRLRRPKKRANFWLIPGVHEMLADLAQRYPLAVVSARDEVSTLAFLDQFDLRGFFKVVVTAHSCEYTKPFPHPVVFAAQQMGAQPAACVMIGDTTVDIASGRAAGAQTVGVLCGFGDERELRRAGADAILPSTADMAQLLG